jgi:hypothetical protein
MLNIMFAPLDREAAQTLSAALEQAPLDLENRTTVALLSAGALADAEYLALLAADDAPNRALVLLERLTIPPALAAWPAHAADEVDALVEGLQRQDFAPRRTANRRALAVLLTGVIAIFVVAVIAIATQMVAFPQEEFEADATSQARQIEELIAPTLVGWQPRSTQDAMNFAATAALVPTRYRVWVIETATALPGALLASPTVTPTATP